MRLLAITRKPDSPSYEQRVLRYIPLLAQQGIEVIERTLPDSWLAQRKLLREISTMEVRAIWWHRHLLTPTLLPALRRTRKPIIFDFDDPLTLNSKTGKTSLVRKMRFALLLRHCDAVLTASEHLASIAKSHCKKIHILPMAIDTPKSEPGGPPPGAHGTVHQLQLLWVGSPSTQSYLDILRAPLEAIAQSHPHVSLRLIAHQSANFGNLKIDFRKWSHDQQAAGLRECEIGLCPMPDTPWTTGKCPFKVVQYMAHGLPWVGSAVGENITTAGRDRAAARGLVAKNSDEWIAAIRSLLDDAALRKNMGANGRAYVAEHHDRQYLVKKLATIFQSL